MAASVSYQPMSIFTENRFVSDATVLIEIEITKYWKYSAVHKKQKELRISCVSMKP